MKADKVKEQSLVKPAIILARVETYDRGKFVDPISGRRQLFGGHPFSTGVEHGKS